jgi:hypothetical protein
LPQQRRSSLVESLQLASHGVAKKATADSTVAGATQEQGIAALAVLVANTNNSAPARTSSTIQRVNSHSHVAWKYRALVIVRLLFLFVEKSWRYD